MFAIVRGMNSGQRAAPGQKFVAVTKGFYHILCMFVFYEH